MHADTDAIRGFAGATADLGADLRAAAAAWSPDLGPTIADAFGPVGARFAQALTDAIESVARSVSRIGDDVVTHGSATTAAACRYDDAELSAREQVSRVVR